MKILTMGAIITFKAALFCLLAAVVVATTTEQCVASSTEELPTCEDPQQPHNASSSSSLASADAAATSGYRHVDDASWAIVSPNLSRPHSQALYDDFIEGCKVAAGDAAYSVCVSDEANRLSMNANQPSAMHNFTKQGFAKVRAPDDVMKLLQDFFHQHRDSATEEWEHLTPYHNSWVSPPTILRLEHAAQHGYGGATEQDETYLPHMIAEMVKNSIELWTGQEQRLTSVYGIRLYHNQSILTPHVDRLPLVSSAIINVAQDVDEDWLLEVYDHDGVAHNVTMQPGDMVLYESHSVIHGRPFPLNGKFYANVFVHFEPVGRLVKDNDEKEEINNDEEAETDDDDDDEDVEHSDYDDVDDEDDLPYYIIRGTEWAAKYAMERNE